MRPLVDHPMSVLAKFVRGSSAQLMTAEGTTDTC